MVANADHDARFRYDQALVEGAARRGDMGVEAYLIAHDLIAAPASLDCADLGAQDGNETIRAARIVVEQARLLGDQGRIAAGVRERATLARAALAARLPGPLAGAALQLCPGLYNDLRRFETAHDLWRWADGPDPRTRRLIPTDAS